MVAKEDVLSHLRRLEQAVADWRRYRSSVSRKELQEDADKQNMVLHAMLVVIQSCIDIANHIVRERSLKRPETYRMAFDLLAETGTISADLANRLGDLAGMRNAIVHLYWKMDFDRVSKCLQDDLQHLEAFVGVVKKLL